MNKHTYISLFNQLLMCDGVVSKDGEVIKVTASDKLILTFINSRIEFFKKSNRECYDAQEFIALRTASNVKTVERCVSKFHKAGMLLAEKRFDHKTKHNKWFWLGFDMQNYVLLEGDSIKEYVSADMKDYEPKAYYKDSKKQVVLSELIIPEMNEVDYFTSRNYVDPEDEYEWRGY